MIRKRLRALHFLAWRILSRICQSVQPSCGRGWESSDLGLELQWIASIPNLWNTKLVIRGSYEAPKRTFSFMDINYTQYVKKDVHVLRFHALARANIGHCSGNGMPKAQKITGMQICGKPRTMMNDAECLNSWSASVPSPCPPLRNALFMEIGNRHEIGLTQP